MCGQEANRVSSSKELIVICDSYSMMNQWLVRFVMISLWEYPGLTALGQKYWNFTSPYGDLESNLFLLCVKAERATYLPGLLSSSTETQQ